MSVAPVLREATAEDAAALAPLLGQLGYPCTEEQVRERLAGMPAATHAIMLAEREGRVAGLAVGEMLWSLNHDAPTARLALLVTDESVRGAGFGKALVRWFEGWAASRGAARAVLTSALHREPAHAFYRSLGWQATGLRFAKDLGG